MKKLVIILNVALLIIGLSAFQAVAVPISGDIYFGSSNVSQTLMTLNDTRWDHATKLTYSTTKITGESGSFASIPNPPSRGIAFGTITFSPATVATPQGYLWRIDTGTFPAHVYHYVVPQSMSAVVSHQTSGSLQYLVLTLSGTGIAHVVGSDDTNVNWTLTGNQLILVDTNPLSPTYGERVLSNLFTFTQHTWSTWHETSVPEPSVLLFLGAGLLGVWGIRRRMKK